MERDRLHHVPTDYISVSSLTLYGLEKVRLGYPSPDQTECDKFYSCLNGKGSPTSCADGLHFGKFLHSTVCKDYSVPKRI